MKYWRRIGRTQAYVTGDEVQVGELRTCAVFLQQGMLVCLCGGGQSDSVAIARRVGEVRRDDSALVKGRPLMRL